MLWSIDIGSIAGTKVRVHITFILFLIYIWGANYVTGGSGAAWTGTIFMLLLFLCVLLHEFGHVFAARAFGINTPDVTLLPIGGVARLERIPEEPGKEFLIAIAGPLVNVVIALLLMGLSGAEVSGRSLAAVDRGAVPMADRLASVNLFLAAFNLIPAFPMDGGRILRSLLAIRLGFTRATEIAATVGQWFAFVLGFIGLFGNPLLIFIAIFVYLAAASEAQLAAVRSMSRGVPVGAAMITQFSTLPADAPIGDAVELLLRTSQTEFPVVDAGGQLVGLFGRNDMIKALKAQGPEARVADVMITEVPTIPARGRLDEAFRLLQEKAAPAVGVVDAAGRLVGLVTSETIGEMLMVREALPQDTRFGPWRRMAGV
jgi:Zn-dependent protease/CBS domain-containing protein